MQISSVRVHQIHEQAVAGWNVWHSLQTQSDVILI